MADLAVELYAAAELGDLSGLADSIAAGADVNSHVGSNGYTALHAAVYLGHSSCGRALLQAGACPNEASPTGITPLHSAAMFGRADCVAHLLAWGALPSATSTTAHRGFTPLHCAVYHRHCPMMQQLLQAAPGTALATDANGRTPLGVALAFRRAQPACCLLAAGPLLDVDQVLVMLGREGGWAQPLYAVLVCRQRLIARQWEQVPVPCAGLGAALPAVLSRSAEEAALLVRHLPLPGRQRLRTAALCLAHTGRALQAELPAPLVWHVLALSLS